MPCERLPRRALRLRDLILVMRENQIDAAGMDIERLNAAALPDLVECHRRAFEVPARTTAPKWRIPRGAHRFVLGVGFLPKSEIARISLGVLITGDACADFELALVELRQAAVARKLADREVDRAVLSFICDPALEQFRDQRNHLRH